MNYLYPGHGPFDGQELALCGECANRAGYNEGHQIGVTEKVCDFCESDGSEINTEPEAFFAVLKELQQAHTDISEVDVNDLSVDDINEYVEFMATLLEKADLEFILDRECAYTEMAFLLSLMTVMSDGAFAHVLNQLPLPWHVALPLDHGELHEMAHVIFRHGFVIGQAAAKGEFDGWT